MPATVPVLSERTIDFSQMFRIKILMCESQIRAAKSLLFNVRTGHFHRLNALGSAVWLQCTGTQSVARISTIPEHLM